MNDTTAVKLKILGREIQVGCKPGERDALLKAAQHVESEMHSLQSRGNNPSVEKIAIITALNMANELLTLRDSTGEMNSASNLLDAMQGKLEKALD